MQHALITGAAGFIGSHLTERLLSEGWTITGVDNFDDFYAPDVKWQNLGGSLRHARFQLRQIDIRDSDQVTRLADKYDAIVHLAAKAGVRPSIENPKGYQQTNVNGTQNLLELAKELRTPQFVFASSSSVYGMNPNVPWSEADRVLLPISPYASTKVSAELLGHVYSHLYGFNFVALRFFTVYGPRQRPDLAIHKFASRIKSGNPIPIFGDGKSRRDYTYVSDIVEGITSAIRYTASPFEIINLGNNKPTRLLELVRKLGAAMKTEPNLKFLPTQAGDVPQTWASIRKAKQKLGYNPQVNINTGLDLFAHWFQGDAESRTEAQGIPQPAFGT